MKTNIKFTGMESSDALRAYAESKTESFEKVMSAGAFESAICDIELKRDAHHQTGDVCSAEVTLEVEGAVHRASVSEPTMEKAIDKIKDDVLELLRATKGKATTEYLKGAREVKEMTHEEGV